MVNIEKLSQEGPEGPFLTNTDRLLRELNIIEVIFKAQFIKYNEIKEDPFILDQNGHDGIDGRYIASFDLYSDVELFNIQLYKDDYTKRYENSKHTTLLEAELLEVYAKAIRVRDYYNDNLTNDSKIRLDYLKTQKLPMEQALEKIKEHCASIEISDYNLMSIYFDGGGGKFINFKMPLLHYFGDNSVLAKVCQSVINFIDRFNINIPESFQTGNKTAKNPIDKKKSDNKADSNTQRAPETFDELFLEPYRKPEIIESFINVLREVEPPLINSNNAYIGRYKTGFVIWVNKLKGKFIGSVDDKIYFRLLNSKFSGLDFKDEQMFRKYSTTSPRYIEYDRALTTLISQVKTSLPKLPILP